LAALCELTSTPKPSSTSLAVRRWGIFHVVVLTHEAPAAPDEPPDCTVPAPAPRAACIPARESRSGCSVGSVDAGACRDEASSGRSAAPEAGPGWSGCAGQCLRRPTPKAMTRTDSVSADTDSTDSTAMRSFARADSDMVSVGLNTVGLVMET
jgi:hypothetical protein